jgi:hypothetical protein
MTEFDRLINEQLRTMEKLLFIQSEIERCQEIEQQLRSLQQLTEIDCLLYEISRMKIELSSIQEMFEQQTEEVIRYYQEGQTIIS